MRSFVIQFLEDFHFKKFKNKALLKIHDEDNSKRYYNIYFMNSDYIIGIAIWLIPSGYPQKYIHNEQAKNPQKWVRARVRIIIHLNISSENGYVI